MRAVENSKRVTWFFLMELLIQRLLLLLVIWECGIFFLLKLFADPFVIPFEVTLFYGGAST
jgi:hypothetical protein